MPTFVCPHCQTRLNIPDEFAGQSGRCNHCQGRITVPQHKSAQPPPLPPNIGNAEGQGIEFPPKGGQESDDFVDRADPNITKKEKQYMLDKLKKVGLEMLLYDQSSKACLPDDPQTISSLLSHFANKDEFNIALKLVRHGEKNLPKCKDIIAQHFFYMHALKAFYKQRDVDSASYRLAKEYCRRQIQIAPKVALAMQDRFRGELPNHTGFEQLAIILEKEGAYTEALELCKEAKSQGWGHGTSKQQDWDKRIARIKKKIPAHGAG